MNSSTNWLVTAAYRVTMTASSLAGKFFGLVCQGARRRMHREYASVLPLSAPEVDRVIDRFFVDYLRNKADVFFYPGMGEDNIERFVTLEGVEHLRAALARGKGAVLIHTHMGNPQMLMPAIGHRGYKLCQVGMTPMDVYRGVREITGGRPNLSAYLWLSIKDKLEGSLPVTFIHLGRFSLKEVFRSLAEGAFVAMTVDGVSEGDGVRDFLGRQTGLFSSGPIRVALRSGADLLPLFVLRDEQGRHRVVVEPPIRIADTLPKQQAIDEAMAQFLGRVEEYVRRYPWLYGRFLGFHNDKFFLPNSRAGEVSGG